MKFYRSNVVVVSTRCDEGGVSYNIPADVEYRIHDLGRGLWSVEDEGGYRRFLRTASLQRFIRGLSRRYVGDCWSSGEPQYFVSEVYITRA